MSISVLDLFTIGIGPSSSHTVGPMRAARRFAVELADTGLLDRTLRVEIHLYGSLALTGRGHGTDRALLLGIEGAAPETVDVDTIAARMETIRHTGSLRLNGSHPIAFDEPRDLRFHGGEALPRHANGMWFVARDADDQLVLDRRFYSVGGGFVVTDSEFDAGPRGGTDCRLPFPYASGNELLCFARESGLGVAEMTLRNESCWRPEPGTRATLLRVWHAMEASVARGCRASGHLPGPLRVARRAPRIHHELTTRIEANLRDPLAVLDWVSMWALAVNEENAAGGRVVTAPTNGAAGIVPAVLHYLVRIRGAGDDAVVRFLLTAGAIALLYKRNASISGAEVGCQGEVGVACSMAAAALTEALGGTVPQVENAAEIGMEHNLGLTCDPVGGLVQIPCIERNAMGAVKAINAARLALAGDGTHRVSLDRVIATMRQTGADMSSRYRETSRGGLAVNVVEC
jgi:L-serine dehydratase